MKRPRKLLGALVLLSLCLTWEAASRLGVIDPVLLPPLSRVLVRAFKLLLSGRLIVQAGASLARVFLGFLLAAGVALPAGILLGLNPSLEDYVNLTLQGMTAATRGLDKRVMWAGFTLGATRRQVLRHVILPALLPAILTQLRVGLGLAWMCVIAAEMVAVRYGLGYMMIEGRNLFRVEDVLVGMATVGILGEALDAVLRGLERRLLRWRRGAGAGELFYQGAEP